MALIPEPDNSFNNYHPIPPLPQPKEYTPDYRLDSKKYIEYQQVTLIYKLGETIKTLQFNQLSHGVTSLKGRCLESQIKLYKKDVIEDKVFTDCFYIRSANNTIFRYDSLVVKNITEVKIDEEKYYLYVLEAKDTIEYFSPIDSIFEKRTWSE